MKSSSEDRITDFDLKLMEIESDHMNDNMSSRGTIEHWHIIFSAEKYGPARLSLGVSICLKNCKRMR